MNVKDTEIKELLNKYKRICVYGLSPDKAKPSHGVPLYMRNKGWEVLGIYPKTHSESNFKIYKGLYEVPLEDRKFVDVFRASEKIPEVVEEVISVGGVEVLWLQLGIENAAAEKRAEEAGIRVVSNRCLKIEQRKWF